MHIHILGISGTFMSALAILAREAGYHVTGSDANCYEPVKSLLEAKGIEWTEGYEDTTQALKADCVVVGNAISRGKPVLEAVISARKPYTSGPQWLADNILHRYQVIAIAGTHGKTTTTSMLAWILHDTGCNPGFLIGGVAPNFNTSARLGDGKWFVIEADEYDSAFFDKRPKFMHYRPQIAILNNLEFDHADIYSDLAAIQKQFHYLMRCIPKDGLVLKPQGDAALNEVIASGTYSTVEGMTLNGDADWRAELLDPSGSAFKIFHKSEMLAEIHWPLIGRFNVENGLAAFAASIHAGVNPELAARALERFAPVKRRLEVKYQDHGITVYDDFAHHPTAIEKTISALKQSKRHERVIVLIEFASYTMRTGVHLPHITKALEGVDAVYILEPNFSLGSVTPDWSFKYAILKSTDALIEAALKNVRPGDALLVMSNRGFDNIHQRLIDAIPQHINHC
jgi:UDP-N-acetylmuramate: L-alanyl-gamma-D-glutamyl-meso-diaminopimelate ligase